MRKPIESIFSPWPVIALGLFLVMFFGVFIGIVVMKVGLPCIFITEEQCVLFGQPVSKVLAVTLGVAATACGLTIAWFSVATIGLFLLEAMKEIKWQFKWLKFLW